MDYEDKYIKYKKKYIVLKNSQRGGSQNTSTYLNNTSSDALEKEKKLLLKDIQTTHINY